MNMWLEELLRRLRYEWFYLRGKPPWDTNLTPPELRALVEDEQFVPGRALDIGCGTGTNVIYLAQHGFDVTGIDFVPRAIARARTKAQRAQVSADLRVGDVLSQLALGTPFDLVLDIGCFHNFDGAARTRYEYNLANWTHRGSTYLLYAFFPRVWGSRTFGIAPDDVQKIFGAHFSLLSSTSDEDSAWYRWERK
jgi:SAM-dependent methyltransferase